MTGRGFSSTVPLVKSARFPRRFRLMDTLRNKTALSSSSSLSSNWTSHFNYTARFI